MKQHQPIDFVGTYTMQQGSVLTLPSGSIGPEGVQTIVQVGNTVHVGTEPASSLHKTENGYEVGVVVMEAGAQKFPASGSATCYFDEENRVFIGRIDRTVIQLSLYWDSEADYRFVYGVLTYGDPENVGVWGATDQGG